MPVVALLTYTAVSGGALMRFEMAEREVARI